MLRKLAVIASLPACILAARMIPIDRLPGICVFHSVTGWPCPTCGMTRSVVALAHLDLGRALAYNAATPVMAAIFALWWGVSVYQTAAGRRTRLADWTDRHMNALIIIALIAFLAWGALRIVLLPAAM